MIRLTNTTSDLISLITAQNGAKVVVSYSDATATAYTGGNQVTSITSATTTTICGTPAASTIRDVDYININNTFAGSHSITVQVSVSATLYTLFTIALLQSESLSYTHGSGWCALDANGNRKEVTSSNFGALTATSITDSGLTSGRVTYATTGGLLTDSANLTFNGTTLTANTIGAFTLGGTVSGGGNQINNVIIGTTTPLAGSFTTLSSTGAATVGTTLGVSGASIALGGAALTAIPANSNAVIIKRGSNDASVILGDNATVSNNAQWGINGTATYLVAGAESGVDRTIDLYPGNDGTIRLQVTTAGAAVTGTLSATGAPSFPYTWANTGGTTAVMVDSAGTLFKLASARKYKTDFAPYTKGLADVLKLNPTLYRLKSANGAGYLQGGLIADDLDAIGMTEFVAYGPEGVDSINYGHMAALFTNALKEIDARLSKLEH